MFETPDIGPNADAIAVDTILNVDESPAVTLGPDSGGAVVTKNLAPQTVYLAVAYDEIADYDGREGPPPAESPIAIYSAEGRGRPAAASPGAKTRIKLSFDEKECMGQ